MTNWKRFWASPKGRAKMLHSKAEKKKRNAGKFSDWKYKKSTVGRDKFGNRMEKIDGNWVKMN